MAMSLLKKQNRGQRLHLSKKTMDCLSLRI